MSVEIARRNLRLNTLERHCQGSLYSDGRFKNKCEDCHKNCCSLIELRNHKKIHNIKELECSYCEKTFTSKFRLKTHIDKRSENNCNECGKLCCYNKDLKFHHQNDHSMK